MFFDSSTNMLSVVLLLAFGCVLAEDASLKYMEINELPLTPTTEPEEQPTYYPYVEDFAASNPEPVAGVDYHLSYADYQVTWESFKSVHKKRYITEAEEKERFNIFMENVKLMEYHNWEYYNGNSSFYLGINHFSDLTNEEYRSFLGSRVRDSSFNDTNCNDYFPKSHNISVSVDWRKKGYVTAVKDQGWCGSCYAFSATGAIEGQWFKKSGDLVSLSEQQILDCSNDYHNGGCNGGYVDTAFQYVIDAGGLDSEIGYLYKDQAGKCEFDIDHIVATISSCSMVRPIGSEKALQIAIDNVGPISIYIDASSYLFQHYKGGVLHDKHCSSSDVDHAVLAVGYGHRHGKDYWIVKNSWSESWGDKGYILMARNKDNQCGVAMESYFPNV